MSRARCCTRARRAMLGESRWWPLPKGCKSRKNRLQKRDVAEYMLHAGDVFALTVIASNQCWRKNPNAATTPSRNTVLIHRPYAGSQDDLGGITFYTGTTGGADFSAAVQCASTQYVHGTTNVAVRASPTSPLRPEQGNHSMACLRPLAKFARMPQSCEAVPSPRWGGCHYCSCCCDSRRCLGE